MYFCTLSNNEWAYGESYPQPEGKYHIRGNTFEFSWFEGTSNIYKGTIKNNGRIIGTMDDRPNDNCFKLIPDDNFSPYDYE